jgi:hypothetical protein
MHLAGLSVLLAGCGGPDGHAPVGDPPWPPEAWPEITAISAECDVYASEWTFEVKTMYWTGSGRLWLATTVERAERHALPSVEAEADGSADRLKLTLDVVRDWRNAVSGSSTAYRCGQAEALSYLVQVYTPDGEEVADCRSWGFDPEIWSAVDGSAACDERWDTGGGGG